MNEAYYKRVSDEDFVKYHDESSSYMEFYRKLGYVSSKNLDKETRCKIKERENALGLNKIISKYSRKVVKEYKSCLNCGKIITSQNEKFCCVKCCCDYKKKQRIEKWKATGDTGTSVSTMIRGSIRDYILEKQQCKCSICGIENKWNEKPMNFVLDHINGDASNNNENNLRLICPNCDSQLDTYKSKNKNSARTYRK